MTDAVWNGADGTSPHNFYAIAANWNINQVPDGTASFGPGGFHTIVLGSATVGNWTFGATNTENYTFNITGGSGIDFTGAGIVINDSANHTINNDAAWVKFHNSSTAATMAIVNHRFVEFHDTSTAASANIASSGTSSVDFFETSTATNATMSFVGASSHAVFHNSSAAANATLTCNDHASVEFRDTSSGGNARFIINATALLNFANVSGAAVNNIAGSIEGAGTFDLGFHHQLTVGSNGLSTTVSGVVSGLGSALVKAGAGTMTLSGANTYTGATHVKAGVLALTGQGITSQSTSMVVDHGAKLAGNLTFAGTDADSFANKGTFTGVAHLGGGNDNFNGTGGSAAKVFGDAGNDHLTGGAASDTLTGGLGKDTLAGGAARDVFDFNAVGESTPGANHDIINAFQHGVDQIDLRTIDAKAGGRNDSFTFIVQQPFHHVKGELHFRDLGAKCLVQGDVSGDGRADFEILVQVATLSKADFLL
jgi:fibronectin-binding autotransporter adhesin